MGDACFKKDVEFINGDKSYRVDMAADVRYCCFIYRSSHHRFPIKKSIHRKTPLLESNFYLKKTLTQVLSCECCKIF